MSRRRFRSVIYRLDYNIGTVNGAFSATSPGRVFLVDARFVGILSVAFSSEPGPSCLCVTRGVHGCQPTVSRRICSRYLRRWLRSVIAV